MTKRKLQPFEIQSASGTLTDVSVFCVDDMPVLEMPLEIKGLENVEISVKPLAATKPFVPKWYFDFEESYRESIESLKPGDSATVTMEWLDIIDGTFIVDHIEGLRVYLRKP